jgi:hypothetical protein
VLPSGGGEGRDDTPWAYRDMAAVGRRISRAYTASRRYLATNFGGSPSAAGHGLGGEPPGVPATAPGSGVDREPPSGVPGSTASARSAGVDGGEVPGAPSAADVERGV